MDAGAHEAVAIIRGCVETGRYRVTQHFTRRMDERGLFWPDVLAVLDEPGDVRDGGADDRGRPKWIIAVNAAASGGQPQRVELVAVLDESEAGDLTVFITFYWSR